mgnify:CR=1 FL=1
MEAELLGQLGVAGGVIAAVILLLREIRKGRPDTANSNGTRRVTDLETRTDKKLEKLDTKIESQGVQLDCLSREQAETRSVVSHQSGKLDAILEIVRRS